MKAKRNAFAVLGWIVWKILAVFGVQYAKSRLADHEQSQRVSRRESSSLLGRLRRR